MKKNVTFKNRVIDVAADLYLPTGFDENKKYAAIVVVYPGSSCKEQTAAIYAGKLAEQRFVTLAVNASHYDLYDNPEFVNPAVEKLTGFYRKYLG